MPLIAGPFPKCRMRNITRGFPVPVGRDPQTPVLISSCLHEPEVLTVGHLIPIDGEPGDSHDVIVVLVIPTELFAMSRETQRDAPFWNLDGLRLWLASLGDLRLR